MNNSQINVLSEEQANNLINTEFTSEKSFKVINVYRVEGYAFKKYFDHSWTWAKPMQVIETDHGWFVDATLEAHGATLWSQKTYDNCRVSFTKGRYKPLWLQKDRDEAVDQVEAKANFDLI